MTVSVLGSGAIGSLIGGLLALGGYGVSFLRGDEELKRGLRIALPNRWLLAKGIQSGPVRNPEILLIALGRHHLRELKKEDFKGLVLENTRIVLCNAEPHESERLGFIPSSCSLLVTLLEAVKIQDSDVELVSKRSMTLAERKTPAESIARVLAPFGLVFQGIENARACLNSLFVYQLFHLAVSLCNTTPDNFLSFPEGRRIASGLIKEGIKAMERGRRLLAKLPLMDPQDLLLRLEKDPESFNGARYKPDRAYPPILQDMMTGRPAETRELNKRVVELAGRHGMELPMNWRLFQKAGRAASVGYYRDPAELFEALR
jgi:ketopantoate reductase